MGGPSATLDLISSTAGARGGSNSNHFEDFRTEKNVVENRILPSLAHLFQVGSTAVRRVRVPKARVAEAEEAGEHGQKAGWESTGYGRETRVADRRAESNPGACAARFTAKRGQP